MAVTLTAKLSRVFQSGLAVTILVFAEGTDAPVASLSTTPVAGTSPSPVQYKATFTAGTPGVVYDWMAVDASANPVYYGDKFQVDASGNEVTLASVSSAIPATQIVVRVGTGESAVQQAGPVINPFAAMRYYAFAAAQRVASGIIGDSNMGQGDPDLVTPTSGHGEAYQRWLCAKFGMGMTSPCPMDFVTNNQSCSRNQVNGVPIAIPAGLPSAFEQYCLTGAGFTGLPSGPYYNPPGNVVSSAASNMLVQLEDQTTNLHGVVDTSEAFTAWVRYGTFPTNTGQQFRPSVRKGFGTGTGATLSADINTVTGAYGLADAFIPVPATPRSGGALLIESTTLDTRAWIGPGFIRNAGFIRTNGTTGVTCGCILYLGGASTWHCATSLLATPLPALAELLRDYCIDQISRNQDPVFQLRIIEGGNDRNSTVLASYDPDTFTATGPMSHTPQGFYNNNLTCKLRLLAAWVLLGFNPDRFFTTYGPYTEQAAFVSVLAAYETAVAAICQRFPRTDWVTRGTVLFDAAINDDMNWPRDGDGEDTDDGHWKRAAYHAFAGMTINAELAVAATPTTTLTPDDVAQIAQATTDQIERPDGPFQEILSDVDDPEGIANYVRTALAPDFASVMNAVQPQVPGAGADPMTWTVTLDNVALADADVWITRDIAGLQVVDRKTTNTLGKARFLADKFDVDGTTLITYYAWAEKDGVRSIQADPITCD